MIEEPESVSNPVLSFSYPLRSCERPMMRLEDRIQFIALSHTLNSLAQSALTVKKKQSYVAHAVAYRKSAPFLRSDVGDQIDQITFAKTFERFAGLFLQRRASGTLGIMYLHHNRFPLPHSGQIMLGGIGAKRPDRKVTPARDSRPADCAVPGPCEKLSA